MDVMAGAAAPPARAAEAYDTAGAVPRQVSSRDGLRLGALEWPGPADRTPVLCLPGISRTALYDKLRRHGLAGGGED